MPGPLNLGRLGVVAIAIRQRIIPLDWIYYDKYRYTKHAVYARLGRHPPIAPYSTQIDPYTALGPDVFHLRRSGEYGFWFFQSAIMQTDSEVIKPTTEATPSAFIRLLAQITTTLHFIESVGATFILWLIPSLTPEPRIHHYISRSTSTTRVLSVDNSNNIHHRHHHHHHQHLVLRRSPPRHKGDSSGSSSVSPQKTLGSSDPIHQYLEEVNKALETGVHIPSCAENDSERRRNAA
ncbi:LOW QUALITY PROTEIN: hypothetical protein CVT26_009308 [Gymnopilus dilepis]|uniref:Uncharacterized protein n=1 Tax=Gymnopilus dilepis TaxID=231916 RepID=A0A409YAC7_9AGAR|nr:LOW QUALITY PROTEIN: hypothetical protein CVT26_009308 [Gymnopilus dilepis]